MSYAFKGKGQDTQQDNGGKILSLPDINLLQKKKPRQNAGAFLICLTHCP